MNKKQLFATAMSAVLLFNSTPTSALAAELNAQQPAAVTAGLAGAVQGAPARDTASQAEEKQADAAQTDVVDSGAAPEYGQAAQGDASAEPAQAGQEAAAPGEVPQGYEPAAPVAGPSEGAAAADAAAAQSAPAFDVKDYLTNVGAVSYRFVDENGKQVYADSVTLQTAGGATLVSGPAEQGGKWVAQVTLDTAKIDPANFAHRWAVPDPSDYQLDAAGSKLTLEYRTNGVSAGYKTYYASGSDRASLVFKKKAAAQPELAVRESANLSQADLKAASSIYDLFGVTAKDAQGQEVADTKVDYTIKDAAGKTYVAADWLKDTTAAGTYTITWTYAGITKVTTVTVRAAYTLEAPATATVGKDQTDNFKAFNKELAQLLVTKAVDDKGNNVVDQVQVSYADANGRSVSYKAFKNATVGSVFTVTFTIGSVSASTKVTIAKTSKPSVPAFKLADKINTYGSVRVRVDRGTGYTDATFTYVPATALSQLVTAQSEPVQRANGTWEVTVTIDPSVAKRYVNPKIGDDYALDADGSRLTATFETLSATGTSWYVKTGSGAELLFKKAPQKADLHVFGTPENTVVESATLSAHVGDKLGDVKGFELAPTREGWKFDGWFLDAGYRRPASADTVVSSPWFAVYAKWERTTKYELSAVGSATYTPEKAKGLFGYKGSYKNGDANIRRALVTSATADGTAVDLASDDVKVVVWKNGSNGFFDLVAGKEGTYRVDFTLGDKTASTVVTVRAGQPVAKEHTVTVYIGFDRNGDGNDADDTKVVKVPDGQLLTIEEARRAGYTFAGLSFDKEGTKPYDLSTPVTSDLTLYAQWKKDEAPEQQGGANEAKPGNEKAPGTKKASDGEVKAASKKAALPQTGDAFPAAIGATALAGAAAIALGAAVSKRRRAE